jgi:hypothetical protein
MKHEKRIVSSNTTAKPGDLPLDFLKLVEETMEQALQPGLQAIRKIHAESKFQARGAIFGDEVLLSISLTHGTEVLSATTVHASVDYQPGQEKPSLQELLALCVDSIGQVFQFYLDPAQPERVAQIAESSLGALEEAPFEWTPMQTRKDQSTPVHVKIDKSNPLLDQMAEEWLKKNDPDYSKSEQKNHETEFTAAEEFLEERIEAIRAAKAGTGTNQGGGPIRH